MLSQNVWGPGMIAQYLISLHLMLKFELGEITGVLIGDSGILYLLTPLAIPNTQAEKA